MTRTLPRPDARALAPLVAALILATAAVAQEPAGSGTCPPGESSVETARVYLPGQWDEAVRVSRETGRCLLVKGVGQIVDRAATLDFGAGQC